MSLDGLAVLSFPPSVFCLVTPIAPPFILTSLEEWGSVLCCCQLEFSVWSVIGFGALDSCGLFITYLALVFDCVFFYSFDCSAHILLKYGKISNIKNIRETWRDSMFTARNTKNWIYFCAHGSDNCVTFVQKGWDVSWDSDNLLSQHKFNYWRANSLVLLLTMFWMPADNKSITIPLKLFLKIPGLHFYFVCHGWSARPFHQDGNECDYMITLLESHVSCFHFCSRWEWFIAMNYTWKISPWGTSECKIKTTV